MELIRIILFVSVKMGLRVRIAKRMWTSALLLRLLVRPQTSQSAPIQTLSNATIYTAATYATAKLATLANSVKLK